MCLNYPETMPPPQSKEKLSSTKLVPGAKNGDCYKIILFILALLKILNTYHKSRKVHVHILPT